MRRLLLALALALALPSCDLTGPDDPDPACEMACAAEWKCQSGEVDRVCAAGLAACKSGC